MAIINRDLDASEQLHTVSGAHSLVVANVSRDFCKIASAGDIKAIAISARAVSGAPIAFMDIKRWSGAGVTTIQGVGLTLVLTAHGISTAWLAMPLAAAGSSLLSVQAGDVCVLRTANVANTAADDVTLDVVVKAAQDIKQTFGVSV